MKDKDGKKGKEMGARHWVYRCEALLRPAPSENAPSVTVQTRYMRPRKGVPRKRRAARELAVFTLWT